MIFLQESCDLASCFLCLCVVIYTCFGKSSGFIWNSCWAAFSFPTPTEKRRKFCRKWLVSPPSTSEPCSAQFLPICCLSLHISGFLFLCGYLKHLLSLDQCLGSLILILSSVGLYKGSFWFTIYPLTSLIQTLAVMGGFPQLFPKALFIIAKLKCLNRPIK